MNRKADTDVKEISATQLSEDSRQHSDVHKKRKRSGKRKPSVLVVDDNYEFFQIVSLSCKDELNIDYAQDGFTAFQMVRRKQFDLILCDVMMPLISGLSLLREFRKKNINVPFLFLTGNATDEVIREALHAGAYNLIQKPFNKEDLLDKINLAIELHRVEQPSEIDDQDKAYIYNTLKSYYYDVEKMLRVIKKNNIPVSVIHAELDKKIRTGKCSFDDLANLKQLRYVS